MQGTGRKCAAITGAGSGIGAATSIAFAQAGYDVVINYRSNRDGAEAVADQCRAEGVEAITVIGDIASDEACRSIAAAAAQRFSRIDVLVNNAGVTRYAPANDLDASDAIDFEHIFSVNVTGSYQMIRAAAPYLKKVGHGSIVNISSDSAFSGDGSSLAYAASKGAINTMTVGLARSLAPAIRVNAVCPGFVDTTWALSWHDEDSYGVFRENLIAAAPLQSIPCAPDIADAVLWLADRATKVTGQCLVIDSGMHLAKG